MKKLFIRKILILYFIITLFFIKTNNPVISTKHTQNNSVPSQLLAIGLVAGGTVTGFTLAEVLITLLIIGVVSSIVIPVVIQDVQDAELKTAWKKTFANLNQATKLALMDNGGSFSGLFNSSSKLCSQYTQHLNYIKKCGEGYALGNCWHSNDGSTKYLNNLKITTWPDSAGAVINDGLLMSCTANSLTCEFDHGIPICGRMFLDVNGFKKPNVVGKDIFGIWITVNSIKPFGVPGDGYYNDADLGCSPTARGLACAAMYLSQ